ncbi:MAG: hypothetical protein AAFR73_12365 [Pseudomonadota bacterium]
MTLHSPLDDTANALPVFPYESLPAPTLLCIDTFFLRLNLKAAEPAPDSIVSAEQARAEGLVI